MDAASNTQLNYTNLIILLCNSVTQSNSLGEPTLSVSLEGDGSAYYISAGKANEISWRMDSASGALTFYDADGKKLSVLPGKTYIGIVKSSSVDQIVMK